MTTTPSTQNRTTAPVATAPGRSSGTPRRLAGLAVGVLAAVLLTAGATSAGSAPSVPVPLPGPWPTAPTCAELHAQRTATSPACDWYRSRALAQASRLPSCIRLTEPHATFRFVQPTPY
ncbi:hypothetical protein [Cellulomonas sp. P5_E12]